MNVLQCLVHGGGAFLFTVNQVDLALSAAGGAEIVEQFVVVGVAGYAAYSAWLHAELKKNGVAAEAVVYQFEYSSDWADDFPTEDCYVCYRFTAADGRVYKGKKMLDFIFEMLGEMLSMVLGKLGVWGWVVLVLVVVLIVCVCIYLH